MRNIINRVIEKVRQHGVCFTVKAIRDSLVVKAWHLLFLFIPPIIPELYERIKHLIVNPLPRLPKDFKSLPRSQHGLFKLITDFEFSTVLDVGSGSGEHAQVLKKYGKKVTALDFGTSVYARKSLNNQTGINQLNIDFYAYEEEVKYDALWVSHVLEHQPDPGAFIKKCMDLTKQNGLIAITVPPLKNEIVGGHLTLWNAGLLLYQLVFNGLDCKKASICTYGYNITIIVKNKKRKSVKLDYDNGDITRLKEFFPPFIDEPFEGVIRMYNWNS